jgi:exosortase
MATNAAHARPSPLPGLLLLAGLVALLFWPTLQQLLHEWERDPSYSHGYLIAPIALVLAWRIAVRHPIPDESALLLGLLSLLAGVVCHLASLLLRWHLLDFAALVLILRGAALGLGGRAWAARFTFPILFLFFLFPLSQTWTAFAAIWLQDIVASWTTGLLDLFFVCLRQGTTIHIAGVAQPLVVAEECSGLRQIVAFVALGALLGHLGLRTTWGVILLMLAAVPVAIVANVLRVLGMALMARWLGLSWLEGWSHHLPALFTFPLGLVLYLLVYRLLAACEERLIPAPFAGADQSTRVGADQSTLAGADQAVLAGADQSTTEVAP